MRTLLVLAALTLLLAAPVATAAPAISQSLDPIGCAFDIHTDEDGLDRLGLGPGPAGASLVGDRYMESCTLTVWA